MGHPALGWIAYPAHDTIRAMSRLVFLLAVFLSAAFVRAQTSSEVEITAEPHHHLLFANDQVRVFTGEVPARAETLMHWHRHDSIEVTLGGAEVVNAVKGKDPVTVKLQDGQTEFMPGNFAHIVRVSSEQTFHNVTIELLQDEKLRQTKPHWDEYRGLDILQNGTKEILFVKDGVRVSEVELQAKGVLLLQPGPGLIVALNKLNMIQNTPNGNLPNDARMFVSLDRGEVRWLPRNHRKQLDNGVNSAKFILIEFP
jgi:hypothetical protein